jgi:hypothetical protein
MLVSRVVPRMIPRLIENAVMTMQTDASTPSVKVILMIIPVPEKLRFVTSLFQKHFPVKSIHQLLLSTITAIFQKTDNKRTWQILLK